MKHARRRPCGTVRTALRRTRKRLGRRGGYLTACGAGWVLYGVQIVQDPSTVTVRATAVLQTLMPVAALGWLWITFASAAVLAAWMHDLRLQAAGFMCAAAMPLLWALGYLSAFLTGEYPGAWAGAATWASAATRLMIVAGWVEYVRPRRRAAPAADAVAPQGAEGEGRG